jgi:hypothetical protein
LMLTLSAIPNSCRIFANAVAKLSPEWDYRMGPSMNGNFESWYAHTCATSTISNTRHSGVPFRSRWTVSATNALWFGEVHASVAKFSSPSYDCISLSVVPNLAQSDVCLPATCWRSSGACVQKPFERHGILSKAKVCNILAVLFSSKLENHDRLQSWRVERFQKPSGRFQL